jgi:hypothetical protein
VAVSWGRPYRVCHGGLGAVSRTTPEPPPTPNPLGLHLLQTVSRSRIYCPRDEHTTLSPTVHSAPASPLGMSGTIAASDDSLDASPQYPLSFTGDNADMVVDVIYIHGGKRVAQNGDQRGSRPGIPTERCPWSFFKNRRYSDRTFIDVLSEKTPEAQRWLDQWLPVANDIEEKDKGRVEAEPNPAHERTDRTIIWVTDDSTAPALIQTLRHADRLAHTWNGGRRRAVDPTYGVIHVRSQRHSTLYTSLLVVGQGVCYWVLRNYDQSRNGFYLSSNSGSSVRPQAAPCKTYANPPRLPHKPSYQTYCARHRHRPSSSSLSCTVSSLCSSTTLTGTIITNSCCW